MVAWRTHAVSAVVLMALLSSCSGDKDDLQVNIGVAARVGDEKIMREEVDEIFEQLPAKQQSDFKGKRGKADFVDKLIEEELIYQEATGLELQYDPEMKRKLRQAERNILITEYFNREILGKIEVSEEEIRKYYDEHQEEFLTRAIINAQHVFTTSRKKAEEWKKRLGNGENMAKIAKEESEDELTAMDGGNLGYFNPGGYVKFIGNSLIWSNGVNAVAAGEISDIIEFEKGFSIVRVKSRRPESILPLSDVRTRIVDKYKSMHAKEVYDREVARLKQKSSPVNFLREELVASIRTAEQLWEIVQMEDDPYERIQYYRDIVNNYPDHKYAPQALFMIGFVYAEELRDTKRAKQTFDELLRSYPDSEVVGSARWMIENVDKPHPSFESFESMKEAMEEKGDGE
jgi:EpsD family peptidyl-prolyl cis-trans isomerase